MGILRRALIATVLLNWAFLSSGIGEARASQDQGLGEASAESAAGVVEQALRSTCATQSLQATSGRARPLRPVGTTLHAPMPVGHAGADTNAAITMRRAEPQFAPV